MKKIFLLSLLSAFFLSAFCQTTLSLRSAETPVVNSTEILAKINIIKQINDDDIPDIQKGIWIFLWREVKIDRTPDGGYQITCSGWGFKTCIIRFKDIINRRDIPSEIMENAYENLIEESERQIARGTNQGSISKKIALVDPTNDRVIDSYLIFQMNWSHDPKKPYNGKAEIIISKTNNLGF